MKRIFLVLLMLLASAGPANACLHKAIDAFVAAVEGKPVNAANLRGCRPPNLDLPPAGSGNWPIVVSAALYLDGQEDSRWLMPWLSGAEGAWGHNGRETGSTIYEGLNWSAALAVRHHACANGYDPALCAAAGGWLRAGLAKWGLAATSRAPARIVFRQAGDVAERSRLGMVGYQGPFAHLVGERQAEKPRRGKFMGSWVELTPVHPLMAWAADVPARRYKEAEIKPQERSLALWVAKTLTGRSYGETLPVDLVGLTPAERETLRAFLTDPTDPALAAELVAWLDTYPSRSRVVTYRRYTSGDVVVVASHTTNANKSGAVVTAGLGSRSVWLLPSRFAGVGAASAQGKLQGDRAIATSNDGGRLELDLSQLGPVAWEAVWSKEGARLTQGQAESDDDSEKPPESHTKPTTCAVEAVGEAADALTCLRDGELAPADLRGLLDPVALMLELLEEYPSLPPDGRDLALRRFAAAADAAAEEARRVAGSDSDSDR